MAAGRVRAGGGTREFSRFHGRHSAYARGSYECFRRINDTAK